MPPGRWAGSAQYFFVGYTATSAAAAAAMSSSWPRPSRTRTKRCRPVPHSSTSTRSPMHSRSAAVRASYLRRFFACTRRRCLSHEPSVMKRASTFWFSHGTGE